MENSDYIDVRQGRVDNLLQFAHFDHQVPATAKQADLVNSSPTASEHLPNLSLDAAAKKTPDLSGPDSVNLNDLSSKELLDVGLHKLSSIPADSANFAAFMIRMKSVSVAENLVKAGSSLGRSEVMGLSSAPLAGLSGYALYKDWQNFKSSDNLCDKSFFAVQSAFDATATAGAAAMSITPFRPAATKVAALSITARLATGFIHSGVDIGRSLVRGD